MSGASSFLDPMLGIDVHWELIPMPAPVPTPIPNPFTGLVFDPMGLAAGILISNAIGSAMGASFKGPVLYWGAFPATNTGTEGKHVPGHILIPPGSGWAPIPRTPRPVIRPKDKPKPPKPITPDNDAVMIFGSKTVKVMGSNACRLGDIALSCSEPVRLPSTVVLAIPKGAPILIGGPMSLDLMAAVLASLRTRFIGDSLQALISRLPLGARGRAMLSWLSCKLTGHPVDVATGKMMTRCLDAELPGPLPLRIERFYLSNFAARQGPLGHGWSSSLDQAVWEERGKAVCLLEDGRELEFDTFDRPEHRLSPGDEVEHPFDGFTLRRGEQGSWTLIARDGERREFAPVPGGDPARARIQRVSSRCGNHQIVFSYDRRGRLEYVRDALGRLVRVECDEQGRFVALKLPLPQESGWYVHRRYEYDEEGDLVRVVDSNRAQWSFEYVTHLMVRETDRNGLSFYFEYDGLGADAWCTRTWGDGGIYDHVLKYDKKNRATYVTNSRGHTTQYFLNPAGLVLKEVDPLTGVREYVYDDRLRCVEEKDPLGATTRRTWTPRGDLISVERPDGVVLHAEYRPEDHSVVRLRDAMGGVWEWQRDSLGRMTEERAPTGERQRFGWAKGRLVWVESRTGARTACTHGADGRTLDLRGPGTGDVRVQYDGLGRIATMQFDGGPRRKLVWDTESRLRAIRIGGSAVLERDYDAEGQMTAERTARGAARYVNRGFRRLVEKHEGGKAHRYHYDTEGLLTGLGGPEGQTWLFERDACGRVSREVDPHGAWRLYQRDAAGRVTGVTTGGGRRTQLAYDVMGRVTELRHGDGTFAKLEYRADGWVSRAENESGVVEFERDLLGRTVRELAGDHEVRSQYDARGLRSLVETSLGWRDVVTFDDAGLPVEQFFSSAAGHRRLKPDIVYERSENGLETGRRYRNALRIDWRRDAEGNPAEQRISVARPGGWETLTERQLGWDEFGTLTSVMDAMSGLRELDIDAGGRLVRDRWARRTLERRAGERGQPAATRDGTPVSCDASARVRAAGDSFYEYDADGYRIARRLPNGAIERYEWNGHGALKAVTRPDGARVEFEYDLFARRMAKRVLAEDGKTVRSQIRYRWDGNQLLHELADSGPARTWCWAPGSLNLVGVDVGGEHYFLAEDPSGTYRTVHQADGELRGGQAVDALGGELSARGLELPWRLTGQYFDEETGLTYSRFRYHDSELGTFISPDPLGVGGGVSPYAHTPNPLLDPDPFGLSEGKYRPWQIHSPGYGDVVQKGLHFYAPGGLELAVRPDHMGGITFTNAIPGDATASGLDRAIRDATDHFNSSEAFRRDILNKAREAIPGMIDHARGLQGSLRDLANGRSREMRDIMRNIDEHKAGGGCSS